MSRSSAIGLVAAITALLAVSEWFLWRSSRRSGLSPAENPGKTVVLVLGFASGPGEQANLVQRLRTRIAVRSIDQQHARFVFSGAAVHGRRTEAAVMADYAVEVLGVPRENVVLEERARSTWQNIEFSIPLLRDADEIVIASDTLHARKARDYLALQAPEFVTRLRSADDYRFGELILLKPVFVAYQAGRALIARTGG